MREQIANRVGVFAAVQPMQIGGTARIRTSAGRAVQFLLEPGRHRVVGGVVGASHAGGGIERLRSFTTTFSQASAERPTWTASAASSENPPTFARSLWQVTQ